MLFHDPLGGDRYGAVWDPALKSPRPFRVLGGFSSIPAHRVGPLSLWGSAVAHAASRRNRRSRKTRTGRRSC